MLHAATKALFHLDCETARAEGVINLEGFPVMLIPDRATTAALLVHGFTATPQEMRPVAEVLAAAGIASYSVRLPGHGTTVQDLSRRSWREWYEVVERAYLALNRDFTTVYGVGMSTGCLLLTLLAAQKNLHGLILFSPYLQVRHRLAPYAGWLRWLKPYHNNKEVVTGGSYYHCKPVAAVHQINLMLKALRPVLGQVQCPALAFNGEADQTVDIESGRLLVEKLGGKVKLYHRFGPNVGHALTLPGNPYREEMFAQMLSFVEEMDQAAEAVRKR